MFALELGFEWFWDAATMVIKSHEPLVTKPGWVHIEIGNQATWKTCVQKKTYCDRPYQLRLSWQLTTPFNWQITRVQGSHHPFQLVGTHSCRLVSKCLIVISHAVHSRILILQQKSFRLANSTIMIPAIHCPEHEQSVHKLYLREVWKRTLPCLFPAHGSTQKR